MAKTIRDEDLILNFIVKGDKGLSAIDKIKVETRSGNLLSHRAMTVTAGTGASQLR